MDVQLYFDTEDLGPHRSTSHPVFQQYFADDLYYDCGDEEAPFGSDEGNDTLWELQERLRKQQPVDFADFPRQLLEEEWRLTYLPPISGQTSEQLMALADQDFNGLPGDVELLNTIQVILATAFGQLKIVGQLDEALQALAFLACLVTKGLGKEVLIRKRRKVSICVISRLYLRKLLIKIWNQIWIKY